MNEKLLNNTIEYIKRAFKNEYSGHDYYHSMRVYKTAKSIAEKEGANIEIVSLAALLHDVDDYKLSKNTHKNKDNARAYLKTQNIGSGTIDNICKIIDEVSFVGTDSVAPSSIEGKCVQDADRLDAIGAIGIARTFTFGGNHNREMYNPDIPPKLNMNKEECRNHISTTVNHFYEKLFLLKDMMNTETGKEIANKRDAFMHKYIKEFLIEWEGKDQ